jgi:hypothetical protein
LGCISWASPRSSLSSCCLWHCLVFQTGTCKLLSLTEPAGAACSV